MEMGMVMDMDWEMYGVAVVMAVVMAAVVMNDTSYRNRKFLPNLPSKRFRLQ